MTFQNPLMLLFALAVPVAFFYAKKNHTGGGIKFSSGEYFKGIVPSIKTQLCGNIIFLRGIGLLFMILALARPQSPIEESKIQSEGIDIVLAIDASTSMLARDFKLGFKKTNRLEAVKNVVKDFINGRQDDRIGLVAFAGRAYMVSPLTLDYDWLLQNLARIKIGMIEDGTAIGSGISSALNRLKDTKAKSKVVILLTDGRNNAGKISPLLAAETAKTLGVKVYTIGAGTKGLAPYPTKDFFGNIIYQPVKIEIDEDTLMSVAAKTEARYFRATDTASLREIYQEIDKMEKTPVEERGYLENKELFPFFLSIGLGFLLIEIILSNTLLRKIP